MNRPPGRSSYEEVDLAIVCEATYPYLRGGLSAVVHQICAGSPHLRIGIIHITWDSSSPSTDLYGVPANVAWVMPVYQSLAEHAGELRHRSVADPRLSRREQRAVIDRFFAAVGSHLAGDDEPLWRLYDDGVNPLTRTFSLWPVLSTDAFLRRAAEELDATAFGPQQLASWLREFISLAFAATSPVFPRAAVYHAHTTGPAGLLSSAAARQHAASFLLTEHNLYVRDTINHHLGRTMDTVVGIDDWRDMDPGTTPRGITVRDRYWMQWFTRVGVTNYRAADLVTYLHPLAIAEAAGLGGSPAKSMVVPNGLDRAPFSRARARFAERADDRRRPDHVWRLAYVGRVVPIKALTDLLDSLADLRRRGFDRFVLDVMGPDDELPGYTEACRRRVAELGLAGRVRWRGSVDLAAELGESDILVMPSHNEGLPIAMLEAMSVGLPVLATDVGGIREVVTAAVADPQGRVLGPCGTVMAPRDRVAMTDAVLALVEDPERYDRLSRNATARIDGVYRVELTLARYHDIYDELGVDASAHVGARPPLFAGLALGDRLELDPAV